MLALSSVPDPLFSNNINGWPLDEPRSHDHNYYANNYKAIHQQVDQLESERSTPTAISGGDTHMAVKKKLNHNASERDRRKKVNCLYSSLRSLLPSADQMKKLSIPATVSRALKYIPELQQQVEELINKKEEVLLRISKQGVVDNKELLERKNSSSTRNCLSVASASRLSENEVVIQISMIHTTSLSEILVEKTCRLDSEVLNKKLLSIYEKRDGIF
ncbi:transcription factor ORG2-like [Quillaja saponaria]|uniref:Transcription factor ORG2-like n=1 Tax=Quillaja saponaria TaxID=32244 RepID=A0AAD7PZS8_QUISA|nr:transcription factor ORG2-like [Quillaja saponaria]